MKNYKISIIVPIYGIEELLPRCIESLLSQTYKNIEILLIDDGSKDNCPQICDEYSKKDNRIKVYHKQNGGLVDAWVYGVSKATGDLISFVDGDDWCENEFLEKLVFPFEKYNVDLSMCDFYFTTDKRREERSSTKYKYKGLLVDEKLYGFKKRTINEPNSFVTLYRWNKLFRKEIIKNNLQYTDKRMTISEDSTIVQSAILDASSIYIVGENLYNYYFRPESMINKYNASWLKKCIIYFSYFKKLYQNEVKEPQKGLNAERLRVAYLLLKNILLSKTDSKREKFIEVCDSEFVKDLDLAQADFSFKSRILAKKLVNKKYYGTLNLVRGYHFIQHMRKMLKFCIGKIKKY